MDHGHSSVKGGITSLPESCGAPSLAVLEARLGGAWEARAGGEQPVHSMGLELGGF